MSMLVALAHPNLNTAIVAVDRRSTLFKSDGTHVRLHDRGGKLMRLASGWFGSGGGCAAYCDEVRRRVAAISEAEADLAAIQGAVAAVAANGVAQLRERWPHVSAQTLDRASFYYGHDDGALGIAEITWDGRACDDTAKLMVAYPIGLDGDRRVAAEAFAARLRGARTYEILRLVAAEFARVAVISDLISPAIEIGVGENYLAGDAGRLSVSADSELRAELLEPPADVMPAGAIETASRNSLLYDMLNDALQFTAGAVTGATRRRAGAMDVESVAPSAAAAERCRSATCEPSHARCPRNVRES